MPDRKKGYCGIAIPVEIGLEIDKVIAAGRWGYRSRAEVVIDALRRLFREIEAWP